MRACSFAQLEVRLGLGGTSYADFIRSVGLPMQLRYVQCFGFPREAKGLPSVTQRAEILRAGHQLMDAQGCGAG